MRARAKPVTTTVDALFSLLVRERDNYTCRSCGDASAERYDCAHIVPRRFRRVRWNMDNAVCLCWTCHSYFTTHPFAWSDWVIGEIGEDEYRELRRLAASDGPKTKTADVLAELRAARRNA